MGAGNVCPLGQGPVDGSLPPAPPTPGLRPPLLSTPAPPVEVEPDPPLAPEAPTPVPPDPPAPPIVPLLPLLPLEDPPPPLRVVPEAPPTVDPEEPLVTGLPPTPTAGFPPVAISPEVPPEAPAFVESDPPPHATTELNRPARPRSPEPMSIDERGGAAFIGSISGRRGASVNHSPAPNYGSFLSVIRGRPHHCGAGASLA